MQQTAEIKDPKSAKPSDKDLLQQISEIGIKVMNSSIDEFERAVKVKTSIIDILLDTEDDATSEGKIQKIRTILLNFQRTKNEYSNTITSSTLEVMNLYSADAELMSIGMKMLNDLKESMLPLGIVIQKILSIGDVIRNSKLNADDKLNAIANLLA